VTTRFQQKKTITFFAPFVGYFSISLHDDHK